MFQGDLFYSVAYEEAYNFIVSPLRRHMMFAHCLCNVLQVCCRLHSAISRVEHDVSNLRKIRRCSMSSNAESQSQVIKVVEKPHYSMATSGAASSAEEAIEAFLFGPDCIVG